MLFVRKETSQDHDGIRAVNQQVFGREEEGLLVERLRSEGYAVISMVAINGDRVAGHIMFSDLPLETAGGVIRGVALAPMAVIPECRNRGFGSKMVCVGLEECRLLGFEAAVVLGDHDYYTRFGFSAEKAHGLKAPFSGESFMALELEKGTLEGVSATVHYPPPFGTGEG